MASGHLTLLAVGQVLQRSLEPAPLIGALLPIVAVDNKVKFATRTSYNATLPIN
ncbi:hypothetical protein BLIF_1356 [Bifidobacterium longum subsp. infantis 157F]|nr:hypothetical protein BLIF_1356 [Bifidobacterium longum subsp. infantis 157F]